MRYLTTLLLAALSFNAVGQTNPNYNPDYDDDGVIGVSDILGILSTFGDTWDSADVIEITPITNDNIHEAVDLWLSDECSAILTYGHISDWDVSSVINMNALFYGASSFNGDISSWDVSSVTDMDYMFNVASNFNQDLSAWDVSSVSSMVHMFNDADAFNGDISSWDVANVTNMEGTFYSAESFNQDISSWDVSQVTNMPSIFEDAESFNQDISSWDVSNVMTMVNMLNNTALSADNKCVIHTSFSSNANWPYDWSEFCSAACGDLVSHEGYDYSTVQIGEQCWFAENCRYLPEVSPSSVDSDTDPYYYVHGYEGTDVEEAMATANYETYGVLYNLPAVMTEGICPSGWHIPSDEEFTQLTDFLGGESVAGGKMKDDVLWNGSNSSGWTGLPGGYRFSGGVNYIGVHGYWWSASESGSYSWRRVLNYNYDVVDRHSVSRGYGFSARCVRD